MSPGCLIALATARTLAQPGAAHGYASPRALAAALVAPRAGDGALSGDGRRVAFSAFTHAATRGGRRLQVFVYDRRTRRTSLVSVLGRGSRLAAEAWEPSLSAHDGRHVAFAATTTVSPPAPLGAFSAAAGATALQPGDARLCSLGPPAW